jgi:hypothetical protein
MKTTHLLLALLVAGNIAACRGGGTDPWLEPLPWDKVAAGERGVAESRSIAQVLAESPDLVQPGGPLLCPNDGTLPFETEASAFNDLAKVDEVRLGKVANHYLFDALHSPADDEQVLRVVGAYDINNVLTPPTLPEGEWISLWAWEEVDGTPSWIPLGRGQTGADGAVDFVFAGDSRLPLGRWRVWAVIEGDGSCAEGGIFVYPVGTRFIVTDIDGTLTTSDEEFMQQIANTAYYPKQHPGATRLHRTWAAKGYEQLYLTARPFGGRMLSRAWLRDDDFPFAYMQTAPNFVFGDPAAKYKGDFVNDVEAKGFSIDYAYGNAESDFNGYIEAGVPLDVQFSILEAGAIAYRGTTPIANDDYNPHIDNYVTGRPDASQPADIPARQVWDPGSTEYVAP